VTYDQINELARWLFSLQNPGAVFAAEDEATRLFWRVKANKLLLDMGPTFPTQNFSDLESRHRK
jgi:hypothetical protein